jgi:autotransporter-associated beta strand protein
VDALTGSGNVINSSNSATNRTLTVGVDNGSGTFSGVIGGGGRAGINHINLTKSGSGTQTLSGANTYVGTTTVNGGTLAITGTYTGGGAITVNAGATLSGSSSGTNTIGNFAVTGASASATLTSGTYNVAATSGNTKIDNGGSLTVDGATLNISGTGVFVPIGNTASTTSTVTLNSGAINVTGQFGAEVGRIGNGILNINGGTFTVNDANSIGLVIGDQATAQSGTVNLSGGTLAVRKLASNNGTNAFNFNGGTLQATTTNSGATFWASSTKLTANVRNGGGTIDNNGTNITIGQALVHSTIGGDNAIDGGLAFSGSGTTTLSGANTYTGNTTINAGTLTLASTGSMLFRITDSTNSEILGTGIGTFNGAFKLDLSGVTTNNTWTLVNMATLSGSTSYGGTFSVVDNAGAITFTNNSGVWTGTGGGLTYEFTQSTGVLTAVPEPHEFAIAITALLGSLIFARRRQARRCE